VRAVRTPSCARFELSGSGSDKVSSKSPAAPQKFSPRSCRCRRRTSPRTRCRKVLRSESAVAPALQDTGRRRNTINEHSLQLSACFRRLWIGFESPWLHSFTQVRGSRMTGSVYFSGDIASPSRVPTRPGPSRNFRSMTSAENCAVHPAAGAWRRFFRNMNTPMRTRHGVYGESPLLSPPGSRAGLLLIWIQLISQATGWWVCLHRAAYSAGVR
jgi:hypothetical protein